mmetsp:Transcript_17862/g.39178  ORF Transcript_17862/g.39178 Transcript_17862/m.39178 type:complete len:155 (+) Transcript_17862:60-524(+)|eukprot:CAMPEP_0170620674 /NCGR_PEP_ID=MMETSP0224-20130122/28184_1 /TAXON_ID=285029 /ORGANISM="Togula jolla, Strain CCCM 725" /LENGTH=154 /DNA_ID=CAMNT_0010946863 /DNA_START=54 /DNA_END=518 /DNA_ORIENTATION=-
MVAYYSSEVKHGRGSFANVAYLSKMGTHSDDCGDTTSSSLSSEGEPTLIAPAPVARVRGRPQASKEVGSLRDALRAKGNAVMYALASGPAVPQARPRQHNDFATGEKGYDNGAGALLSFSASVLQQHGQHVENNATFDPNLPLKKKVTSFLLSG